MREEYSAWDDPKKYWIRWLLLVPCAVFAYGIVLTVFQRLFPYSDYSGWFINYLRSPLITFLGSLVFIIIGVLFAPKYQKRIALILLIVIVMLSSFDLFNSIRLEYYFRIARVCTGLLGGLVGYFLMENKNK